MLNIPYEVQQALRKGDMRKNYKMKVNDVDPDTGERTYLYTIDNDSLVSESVKVDERMVTGKVLKFGLCEGSSLEFQYFDHPNINGKDVQVYCSVEYVDGNGDVAWYDIPMGWYTVDQCPMQWETGIYKVTAYNKLKSKYLDAKANQLIIDDFSNENQTISIFDIKALLLEDYEIEEVYDIVDISDYYSHGYRSKVGSTTLAFKAKYGIHSPLNFYKYQNSGTGSASNSFYLYLDPRRREMEHLNPQKVYKFILDGIDIEKYEDDHFTQLIDKLVEAFNVSENDIISRIVTPYSDSGSGQGEYSAYIGYTGWMGLEVYYDDGTIEYYSKYAYKYNNPNAVGTLKDAINKTFIGINKIQFNTPYYILASSSSSTPYGSYYASYMMCSVADFEYRYYTDSGLSNTAVDHVYDWMYLDGKNVAESFYEDNLKMYIYEDLPASSLIQVQISDLPEFTLRDIASAVYETVCQYGKLDRETDLFAGVELNQGGLYPSETLYPDDALYPLGTMEHPFPSTYSKLWTDTVGEQSFRYLIITYKAMENGQEVEKTLQRTVNADGTTNYNMSDNWLFRNLVWSDADVGDYADAMVLKMKDIRWFPFEMWCAGLPYVETGDAIEITDKQGNTHTSYVLTRTLDGIHNLQDTFINGELDIF